MKFIFVFKNAQFALSKMCKSVLAGGKRMLLSLLRYCSDILNQQLIHRPRLYFSQVSIINILLTIKHFYNNEKTN